MTVLVAAASRHGATYEIAEAIGQALEDRGLDVHVRAAETVDGVAGYEAVVLGSGVYAGRWLEPARVLVEEHCDELARVPAWLFSSGPIGDPPRPDDAHAVDVAELVTAARARDHRVFAGRLDRHRLGFGERAMVFAFRAPDGDFRDWGAIGAWATAIADELQASRRMATIAPLEVARGERPAARPPDRVLAAGLVAIAAGLVIVAVLGPLATDVIRCPISETLESQAIGLDAMAVLGAAFAALAVVVYLPLLRRRVP